MVDSACLSLGEEEMREEQVTTNTDADWTKIDGLGIPNGYHQHCWSAVQVNKVYLVMTSVLLVGIARMVQIMCSGRTIPIHTGPQQNETMNAGGTTCEISWNTSVILQTVGIVKLLELLTKAAGRLSEMSEKCQMTNAIVRIRHDVGNETTEETCCRPAQRGEDTIQEREATVIHACSSTDGNVKRHIDDVASQNATCGHSDEGTGACEDARPLTDLQLRYLQISKRKKALGDVQTPRAVP